MHDTMHHIILSYVSSILSNSPTFLLYFTFTYHQTKYLYRTLPSRLSQQLAAHYGNFVRGTFVTTFQDAQAPDPLEDLAWRAARGDHTEGGMNLRTGVVTHTAHYIHFTRAKTQSLI